MNKNIGCIIVTYNPEVGRLNDVLDSVLEQCNEILIVDNKSSNINNVREITARNNSKIELIELDKNYGIAKALNTGIEIFRQKPVNWILTLDQDTLISCDIATLLDKTDAEETGIVWLSEKERHSQDLFFTNENPIIISGSIINFRVFSYGVKFREEFFLDHVDTDFDYQVRRLNFKVLKTSCKCMEHEWGKEMPKHKKVRYATNFRVYLTIRNGTRLLFEKKIRFILYIKDNYLYISHNIYYSTNIFSIFLIIVGAITDGLSNKFLFLEKFEKLLRS